VHLTLFFLTDKVKNLCVFLHVKIYLVDIQLFTIFLYRNMPFISNFKIITFYSNNKIFN